MFVHEHFKKLGDLVGGFGGGQTVLEDFGIVCKVEEDFMIGRG